MPPEAPLPDSVTNHPWPSWPLADADHLLVTGRQMAQLENQLFASGLPVQALMEKAALGMARRLLAAPPAAALVLVGPGHNGGDALVVARELHLARVPVRLWSPFERHKPLTDAHLRHARWLGIPLLEGEPDPAAGALWIDGVFGVGQERPIPESMADLFRRRQQLRPEALVAIDVPTGLCSDSGRLLGSGAARARTTYCLGLLKQGLVQDAALAWVGQLERIDLGLPDAQLAPLAASQPRALGARDSASAPWPCLDRAAGKYGRGRLLVVAGSPCYPGAAQLCLLGASASGCGSVKALVPEAIAAGLWASQPHVVQLDPTALAQAGALDRFDAVVFGPGLGPGQAGPEEGQLWLSLQGFGGLLLLDADGLNRLAGLAGGPIQAGGHGDGDLKQLEAGPIAWLRQRRGPTWLTPHEAEFERLFPELAGREPLEAAAAAAAASGTTVLLKGAHSVIASADGRRWQLVDTCAAAARAGLGDVLAGYAAGRGAMAVAALRAVAAEQADPSDRPISAEQALSAERLLPTDRVMAAQRAEAATRAMASGRAGAAVKPGENAAALRLDGALLAAAALNHGLAGKAAWRQGGPGGATPMAVAAALAQESFQQSAEICSESDAVMAQPSSLSTNQSQC
jgi:NAD(P)H-hydrate epimerase